MEAATLKMKKQINKGKLKKTIKNVICRPDPVFWPQISANEAQTLIQALNNLKVDIPDFNKPLWSELCRIPKELRPKAPAIPKVEGLIFGLSACQRAVESKKCIGVLIEAAVNPKTIVQPLIETCSDNCVPVLCLKELKSVTKSNFRIPTCVLGVKQNCLLDLETKILELYQCHRPPERQTNVNIDEAMPITTNANEIDNLDKETIEDKVKCPYLYRTDKKIRVFIPTLSEDINSPSNKFIGQNFIKLSNINQSLQNETMDSKQFMKMIVKKISSNPNRRKSTKVSSND